MDQEVLLRMVASIDEGTVKSDVARLAQSMSREMEGYFQKMGESFAQVIINQIGKAAKTAAQELADPKFFANDAQRRWAAAQRGERPTEPFEVGPTSPVPLLRQDKPFSLQKDFSGGYLDPFRNPATAMAGSLVGLGLSSADKTLLDPRIAAAQDIAGTKARMIQEQRKAGIETEISPSDMRLFQQAQTSITESLAKLPKVMEDLGEQLKDSTDAAHKLAEELKVEKDPAKQVEINQNLDAAYSNAAELRRKMQETENAHLGELSQKRVLDSLLEKRPEGMGGGGLMALGAVLSGAAQIPGGVRASQMGFAATENLAGRAAMSGDINRLVAMQMAGGQGALGMQGGLEAGLGVAGNLLGVAGSIAAATSIPGAQGVGALGAMNYGAQTISSVANFGQARQQAVEGMLQKQMGVNAELFRSMSAGREVAFGAADFARQTGMYEYQDFLTGGAQAQGTGRYALSGMGAPTGDFTKERAQYLAGRYGYKAQEMMTAPTTGLAKTAQELLAFTPQETQGFLANMARQAGGVYEGKTPVLAQQNVQGDIARLMNVVGRGGIGAEQAAAAAMGAGGGVVTFKRMVEESEEILKRIVGEGFDKSEAPRIFQRVAEAAGRGEGAGEVALRKEMMALQLAKDTGQERERAGMERARNVVEQQTRQTLGGDPLQSAIYQTGVQKAVAATRDRDLMNVLNRDQVTTQIMFQSQIKDAQALREYVKEAKGIDLNEKQSEILYKILQEQQTAAVREKARITGGVSTSVEGFGQAGGPGSSISETTAQIRTLKGFGALKKPEETYGPAAPLPVVSAAERGEAMAMMSKQAQENLIAVANGMGTLSQQLQGLNTGVKQFSETIQGQIQRFQAGNPSPQDPNRGRLDSSAQAPMGKSVPRNASQVRGGL